MIENVRYDVAVIGAGQAGLAIGHALAERKQRFVILEAADSVGSAWRNRWDSLVLFTPRRYDALPGLAFPGDPDGYPTRDEVAAYLDQYVEHFGLPVELSTPVRSLTKDADDFVLDANGRPIHSAAVVVATGPFHAPIVPAIADGLAADVFQTHSAGYRRPADLPDGRVLVVGGGNTGFQIAKELAGSRDVHLAIGTRQTALPQRLLGRDLFWWLTKLGVLSKTVDSRIGRRARDRDTLIGSSPRDAKRRGVTVHPRAVGADGRTARFADGTELDVDAVIWATGYGPDHSWIDLPITGDDGRLRHRRGVSDISGLYFLGLSWQHTRGSALLGFVADDAAFIADQIAANRAPRAGTSADPAPQGASAAQRSLTAMEHHEHRDEHDSTDTTATFPTDTAGLPQAVPTRVVGLGDGDTVELRIAPVAKRIGDDTVRMIAYNGSIPGPTLRVREGSELVVDVLNEGDLEATVHWHGLRLENRFDGTHETQAPIPVGGRFAYRISFPDPGVYWYHPHIREDYGQELGQYANILVDPAEPDYWPPAHRELLLTLDDIFIEDGRIAPFSRDETTFAAMGRYGNVMLVAGETAPSFAARQGEVVRLYLTNTANTRVFDVALPGARMKLVGGDSGRVEREAFVESVVLAPSERAVVDVLFEEPGRTALEHRTPERTYTLATFDVAAEPATPSLADEFAALRTNPEWSAERERLEIHADAPPDKTLAFVAEMDMPAPEGDVIYACPMHPDVVGEESDRCPKCGMKLVAVAAPVSYVCPMHPEVVSEQPDRCPKCGMKLVDASLVTASGHEHGDHADEHPDHPHAEHEHEHDAGGIEWEDDMLELNRRTTPANMRWMLVDRETGAANHGIAWQFTVGDRVKLRLVNEMDSDHPMHHPFHVHGAGRFVVLARDGVPETNYVWKDTVLVRTGETVDILLDVTNPGRWMAHCHIAEHHESGMMFSFDVAPADAP